MDHSELSSFLSITQKVMLAGNNICSFIICQYFIAFALILRFSSDKEQKLYNNLAYMRAKRGTNLWVPGASKSAYMVFPIFISFISACSPAYQPVGPGTRPKDETFRTIQADAHPAIKWDGPGFITPGQLGQALKAKYHAEIGVRDALTGDKYKFIKEFTEEYEGDILIHRIFEYKHRGRLWLFRDRDVDGNPYENYILVTSFPRDDGGCVHKMFRKGKNIEDVYVYIYKKPNKVSEKDTLPVPSTSNGCR